MNARPLFFIPLFLFMWLFVDAQEKPKRYCQLSIFGKTNSENFTVHIDTGTVAKFDDFQYPSIKEEIEKVKTFKSRIDILNHMSLNGWTLMNPNTRFKEDDLTDNYYFYKTLK